MKLNKKLILSFGGFATAAVGTALAVACGNNPIEETPEFKAAEAIAKKQITETDGSPVLKSIQKAIIDQSGKTLEAALESRPYTYKTYVHEKDAEPVNANGLLMQTFFSSFYQIWKLDEKITTAQLLLFLTVGSEVELPDAAEFTQKLNVNYDGNSNNVTDSWAHFVTFWKNYTDPKNNYEYFKNTLINRNIISEDTLKKLDAAFGALGTRVTIFPTNQTDQPEINPNDSQEEAAAKAQIVVPGEDPVLKIIKNAVLLQAKTAANPDPKINEALRNAPSSFSVFSALNILTLEGINGVLAQTFIDTALYLWGVDKPLLSLVGPLAAAGITLNEDGLKPLFTKLNTNYDGAGHNATDSWADFVKFWKSITDPTDNYAALKASLINRQILTEAQLKILDKEMAALGNGKTIYPVQTPEEIAAAKLKAENDAKNEIANPGDNELLKTINQMVVEQSGATEAERKPIAEALNLLPKDYKTLIQKGAYDRRPLMTLEEHGLLAKTFYALTKQIWKLKSNIHLVPVQIMLQTGGLAKLEEWPEFFAKLNTNYDNMGHNVTDSWYDFLTFWKSMTNPENYSEYFKNSLISRGVTTRTKIENTDDFLSKQQGGTSIFPLVESPEIVAAKNQITNPGEDPLLKYINEAIAYQANKPIAEALATTTPKSYGNFRNGDASLPVNGVITQVLIKVLFSIWGIDQNSPASTLIDPLKSLGISDFGLLTLFNKINVNYDGKDTQVTSSWATFLDFWKTVFNPADNYAALKASFVGRGIFTEEQFKTLDRAFAKLGNGKTIYPNNQVTPETPPTETPTTETPPTETPPTETPPTETPTTETPTTETPPTETPPTETPPTETPPTETPPTETPPTETPPTETPPTETPTTETPPTETPPTETPPTETPPTETPPTETPPTETPPTETPSN